VGAVPRAGLPVDLVQAAAPAGRCGGRAVVDNIHGETRVTQTLADPVGQRNVILHDQHPHLHSVRLGWMTSA
jgi:hypothetical protein